MLYSYVNKEPPTLSKTLHNLSCGNKSDSFLFYNKIMKIIDKLGMAKLKKYKKSAYISAFIPFNFFTRLRGFEPLTVRLEGVCSIQLS